MKRFTLLFVIIASMFSFSACTRINAGYAGIVINMAGDQKGVNDMPTATGWTFYNPISQSVFEYPVFTQTAIWTRSLEKGSPTNEEIAYNSVEGIITSDISLSYSLVAEKVPNFYIKFRSDDLKTFTHGFLRNVARDAFNEQASRMKIDDIYGSKKSELLAAVRDQVNKAVEPFGVKIEQFGFIGEQRLPESVVYALNMKIAATQNAIRVENEIRQAKAQAEKDVAEATGKAEANRKLASSISPQLIQWEQIQLMKQKWNGVLPQVVGSGSNGMNLLIQSK